MNYIVENIMIIFTLSCIVFAVVKNYQSQSYKDYRPALFLFTSLVSASYFSYIDRISGHGLIMMLIAYACIFRVKKWRFSCLDIEKNEVLYALSFTYMIRVGAILMHLVGVIGVEFFWVISMALLSMQNLLVLGDCFNGYYRNNNNRITAIRVKLDALVFSKKRLFF